MPFEDPIKKPSAGVTAPKTAPAPTPQSTYAQGAAATKPAATRSADVAGPIGRVFNRILGMQDDAKGTAKMAFDKEQLRAYLDKGIDFAEGEFFRGTKLDGVADTLIQTLDTDKDGKIGWTEFQAFELQVLQSIAPGVDGNSAPEAVAAASNGRFDGMDKSKKDGSLNFGELQQGTKAELPKGTEHADLVAQLGARIALDAVDKDQKGKKTKDKTLTRAEWTGAATELAGGVKTPKVP